MASDNHYTPFFILRRVLLAVLLFLFIAIFILWRFDGPRVERVRIAIFDRLFAPMELVLEPIRFGSDLLSDFKSYTTLEAENRQLRQELRQMESWREAALQLEQANAELRALNNLSVSPAKRYVTGEIIADSGSPFTESVIVNVGRDAGVSDGAAVVDGLGLVGRTIGVGDKASRVLLLTDRTSNISAIVMPERTRAIVEGQNTRDPNLIVVDTGTEIRAGSRVVTSGDGGVLPPDILLGYVVIGQDGDMHINPAANLNGLNFVRVFLSTPTPNIPDGSLVRSPSFRVPTQTETGP